MALPMCLQIQMAEGGQIGEVQPYMFEPDSGSSEEEEIQVVHHNRLNVDSSEWNELLLIDFPKVPSDSWVPTVLTARLIVWAPTVQQRSSGQTGDS